MVGIGVAVLRGESVLLVRRIRPPASGAWSLPGGAQKLGETAEAGGRRELFEETGLKVGAMVLAGNVDSIHHDAAGRILYHYTILDFAARWQGGAPRAASDVSAAEWVAPADFDRYDLWDEARRIIAAGRHLLGG